MNIQLTRNDVDPADENILGAMPWLRERFLATGGESPDETAHELDKFLRLTQITDVPLAMVGGNVDKMWHRLIEFTEFYGVFCESRYGGFIHHRAKTATSPVPDEAVRNFYRIYEQEYGPVPQIWSVGTPQAILDYGTGKIDALPSSAKWSGWPGRSA